MVALHVWQYIGVHVPSIYMKKTHVGYNSFRFDVFATVHIIT